MESIFILTATAIKYIQLQNLYPAMIISNAQYMSQAKRHAEKWSYYTNETTNPIGNK